MIEPFTPAAAPRITKSGKLVDGAGRSTSKRDLDGADHGRGAAALPGGIATPADCVLAPGTYIVEFTGAAGRAGCDARLASRREPPTLTERFEFGFVERRRRARQLVVRRRARRQARRARGRPAHVTVTDESGSHPTTVRVTPGATVVAN